jgi:hypothetical protein
MLPMLSFVIELAVPGRDVGLGSDWPSLVSTSRRPSGDGDHKRNLRSPAVYIEFVFASLEERASVFFSLRRGLSSAAQETVFDPE